MSDIAISAEARADLSITPLNSHAKISSTPITAHSSHSRGCGSMYCLLIICLLLSPSQSSPVQVPGIENQFPTITASKNVTAVTVPAPPPGFGVDWHYDTNEPLNILGIYLSAIDCMYYFAQKGWDDRQNRGWRTWAHGFQVAVDVAPSQLLLPLLTSHIVVGLYRTIEELSRRRKFCKVTASLSLRQRQIGRIDIRDLVLGRPLIGMEGQRLPNATIGITSAIMATNPSGQIIDDDDTRFTVDYAFGDARIDSQDVFMAILDALANSAPHADDSGIHHLMATSPSGRCELVMFQVPNPHQVTYSYATKALRMLTWYVITRVKRFGEMTFELKWEGVSIAKGYIVKVETSGGELARCEANILSGSGDCF